MSNSPERPGIVESAINVVLRLGAYGAELVLATVVVMVAIEVIIRNAFGISLGVVDELMGYMLVAMIFLGIGQSIRDGALLRVDVFTNMLPPLLARRLDQLFALIGVAVFALYLYELWALVASSFRRGAASGSSLAIPLWVPQSVMVVGVALGILAFAVLVVRPVPKATDEIQI